MRAPIVVLLPGLAVLLLAPDSAYPQNAPRPHAVFAPQVLSTASRAPHGRERSRKPGGAGSFAYQIKDLIRAKSGELCASYGQAGDCVDEVEVCVTMVDEDEAEVRLCLNDSPGDRDRNKTHRSSVKR